jgi:hypothetical protein
LDVLALEPFSVDTWLIGSADVSWEKMVKLLCSKGFSAFGAELGAIVVDEEPQGLILAHLMLAGHFDDAIKFGSDREAIFGHIIKQGNLEDATQVVMDDHFEIFVDWLTDRRDEASMARVRAALREQGRTIEEKRI